MYLFHAGIFQSERLTIVLTCMDTYYTDGGSMDSNPEAMKRKVADQVTDAVGTRISPELVYPVSGRWAMAVSDSIMLKYISCMHYHIAQSFEVR